MTEQFGEFDPAAAAEAYLRDSAPSPDPKMSDEEREIHQRYDEQQLTTAATLMQRGIDLQLQEGQTLDDKANDIQDEFKGLRSRLLALSARGQTGTLTPYDYIEYVKCTQAMKKVQALGDVVDLARMISQCFPGSDNPEIVEDIVRQTITSIAADKQLSPEQRAVFLDVLEKTAGSEVFPKVLRQVQQGTDLEEWAADEANAMARATELAKERTNIQELLIDGFNLRMVNHEDWVPFVDGLHRLARVQRDGAPVDILNMQFTSVYARAERLNIAMQTLSEIFARLDITFP